MAGFCFTHAEKGFLPTMRDKMRARMETVLGLLFFLFGSVIGSFLNVVILRYRSGRGLGGRSLCFSCGTELSWFELIPLASFITQQGKCVTCRAKISWQYPLVEALTGLVSVFLFLRFEYLLFSVPLLFAILFLYYGFMASLLIVMSVYDLKHRVLPDGLTFTFAIAAFVGMFFISGDALILHMPSVWRLVAGIVLSAPFALMWLVSRGRWMGLGDAKLMVGMGWLLGLSAGAAALLISFWMGAIVGILLVVATAFKKGRAGFKTAVPFGPFLAFGTLVVILFKVDLASLMTLFTR